MSEEMEWQPVRIAPIKDVIAAHEPQYSEWVYLDRLEAGVGKIVRVRPYQPTVNLLMTMRAAGCNSDHFFEIHAEDMPLTGDNRPGEIGFFCEHQIQAD